MENIFLTRALNLIQFLLLNNEEHESAKRKANNKFLA